MIRSAGYFFDLWGSYGADFSKNRADFAFLRFCKLSKKWLFVYVRAMLYNNDSYNVLKDFLRKKAPKL
jgi:hypothetical protein